MCLVIVDKGLFERTCDQETFRMPLSKKITTPVTEVILIQVSYFTVHSINSIDNNKLMEYHVI